jgi:hypothetical protein
VEQKKPKERKLLSDKGKTTEQQRKEAVEKEMMRSNPKIDNNIIRGYN